MKNQCEPLGVFGTYEHVSGESGHIFFILPVLHLILSTSRSTKAASLHLASLCEKILNHSLMGQRLDIIHTVPSVVTRPDVLVQKLIHQLRMQEKPLPNSIYCLNLVSKEAPLFGCNRSPPIEWLRQVCQCFLVNKHQPTWQFKGMFVLVGAIFSALLADQSLVSSTIDLLAVIGTVVPELGLSLFLVVLFYTRNFCSNKWHSPEMLVKLLGLLPALAVHSFLIEPILQTLFLMLREDGNPMLYAYAVRLLCQTWEVSDRTFVHLQGFVHAEAFQKFAMNHEICLSIAASIRDICRKNPDRGVDLIVSVSACMESCIPSIQALGFESLGYLCEADLVDFYTAWTVIKKHALDYSQEPTIAYSLSNLLKWGALDADAYPDASRDILHILWKVASIVSDDYHDRWIKSRKAAIKSIAHYQIDVVSQVIPEFKETCLKWITSETKPELLRALEELQIKIMSSEYIRRSRYRKGKKVKTTKIEKILDALPQVLSLSVLCHYKWLLHALVDTGHLVDIYDLGNEIHSKGRLPGAALICLNLTSKGLQSERSSSSDELLQLKASSQEALLEIADSLHLRHNILIALLSYQSWQSFMMHWMKKSYNLLNHKSLSDISGKKFAKFVENVLKDVCASADEAVPRAAENMALAIGALCSVLPSSADAVVSHTALYLLSWLFQYEHEFRQWSAAISLGLTSKSLHVTDSKLRDDIAKGLIEVMVESKSLLVKGACGLALGFVCEDLLSSYDADQALESKATSRMKEADFLADVVRTLACVIQHVCPSSTVFLEGLQRFSLPGSSRSNTKLDLKSILYEKCDNEDANEWSIAALVMGLSYTVSALDKFGAFDTAKEIQRILTSWITNMNSSVHDNHGDSSEIDVDIALTLGACLSLPVTMAFFCRQRVSDEEIDGIVGGFKTLVATLVQTKNLNTSQGSLLMASLIGSGTLLSIILNDGVHPLPVDDVNYLLEAMKTVYSKSYPFGVHLGGVIGLVNAMGAGAGYPMLKLDPHSVAQVNPMEKDALYIKKPLLDNSPLQLFCTSLVQEMLLMAQDARDQRSQGNAAWALSFLRSKWWSMESLEVSRSSTSTQNASTSHGFDEATSIWHLSSWLSEIDYSKMYNVNSIRSVLVCLAQSPSLPLFNWSAIMWRCMRLYGSSDKPSNSSDPIDESIALKEECIKFSLAHAERTTSLQNFLDQLYDLVTFRLLEQQMHHFLLKHIAALINIFSSLR